MRVLGRDSGAVKLRDKTWSVPIPVDIWALASGGRGLMRGGTFGQLWQTALMGFDEDIANARSDRRVKESFQQGDLSTFDIYLDQRNVTVQRREESWKVFHICWDRVVGGYVMFLGE